MSKDTFQNTAVSKWTGLLCYDWADEVIRNNHFDSLNQSIGNFWCVTGSQLLEYRREDFNSLVPGYGDFFYKEFWELLRLREITAAESTENTDVLYGDSIEDLIFGDLSCLTPLQPTDTTTHIHEDQFMIKSYEELSGDSSFSLENFSTVPCAFKMNETSLQRDEMASLKCKVDIYVPNYKVEEQADGTQIKKEPSSLHFTNGEIFTPRYTDSEKAALKYHDNINSKQFSPLEETNIVHSSQVLSSTVENIKENSTITRHSLRSCSTQEKIGDLTTPQPEHPSSLAQYSGNFVLQKIPTKTRKRDRGPKNWEFLVRLLVDESTNPSLVKWEDKSTFTFRIVRSHSVATLWGSRSRSRRNLTYENFARGLRYHYKTKSLQEVSGRKLVYRCGEKAIKFLNELERNVSVLRA